MKKILIAEDDNLIGNAIKQKLESHNFAVTLATDGQEAFEKVKADPPDLILLDIIMPKMDGISFIKEIKKTENKYIPIIVLTNLSDDKHVSEAVANGVTDYLIKVDYSLDKVLSVINKIL